MAMPDETSQLPAEPEVVAEPIAPSLEWHESVDTLPIGFGPDSEAIAIDWDGGGRVDLLVTAGTPLEHRTARIYRQTSPVGTFPPQFDAGTPVSGLEAIRSVCVLPIGSSTRFDLIGLNASGLVLLKNSGTATAPVFDERTSLGLGSDLGLPGAQVAQFVAIDWDGDKLVDLLVGLNDLNDYWPDDIPVEHQVGFNQFAAHPGYDRGGTWRGRAPVGKIRWLKNVGSPGSLEFSLQDEITSETGPLNLEVQAAGLALAWGGGGSLELLTTDRRGGLQLYRNFGGQLPPAIDDSRKLMSGGKPAQLPDDRTSLIAADLDGDGRVELLFGTSDGRVFAVHTAPGRDNATAPVVLTGGVGPLYLGGNTVVATGDLDNDGGLDLIVGDAPGRLHWFKDLGKGPTHRYGAPVELEAGGTPFRLDPGPDGRLLGPAAPRLGFACPTIADWNGNGRADIVLAGAGGDVLWLKNDGAKHDPRFASPVPFMIDDGPLITPPRVRPTTAHWTGSEHLDLIAIDLQGFLCVYPGNGTNELAPPIALVDTLGRLIRLDGAFGQNGRVSLWAGDFCGNGKPCILVGFSRDSRHVIASLLGKPVRSLDCLSTVLLLENRGHNTLIPRMISHADGSPIVLGTGGCSPSGVASGDLIVGTDLGGIHYFRRTELRW